MSGAKPEDRQAAIDALTKRLTDLGKDADESRDVATAAVDKAITDRQNKDGKPAR